MKLLYIVCCVLFSSLAVFSQNGMLLNGKVTTDLEDLKGLTIKNETQNYEKLTSHGGYFSIKVNLNDVLIFAGDLIYEYRHIVTQDDFKTDLLHIRVVKLMHVLEEVKITNSLDLVEMGILDKKPKSLTTAERRLYTASSGPVSLLVNTLNGTRKSLKFLAEMQTIENGEIALLNLYGEENLMLDFNLMEDSLVNFSRYAYQLPKIKEALKTKNKKLLRFLLIDVAIAFKKEFKITN